jgi:hypothetical protein
MPVTPADAEHTLRDISSTARASAAFYGYRVASPHLILWGIIWVIGYGASFFYPQATMTWPLLTVIGVAGSCYFGWQARRAGRSRPGWRYGATGLAVFLFIAALFAVMPPRTDAQVSAFYPILVALFYCLVGIWTDGRRMIVAGTAIAVLTLGGYFYLAQIFTLWMAIVGGGALILGGIWLRRV